MGLLLICRERTRITISWTRTVSTVSVSVFALHFSLLWIMTRYLCRQYIRAEPGFFCAYSCISWLARGHDFDIGRGNRSFETIGSLSSRQSEDRYLFQTCVGTNVLGTCTTQLSPYLKFGCLSVRAFYWRAKDIIDTYQPKKGETVTKEPENLLGQVC
jgi:hypothetical protein